MTDFWTWVLFASVIVGVAALSFMIGVGATAWHLRQPERYPDLRTIPIVPTATFPTEPFRAVIEGEWYWVRLAKDKGELEVISREGQT